MPWSLADLYSDASKVALSPTTALPAAESEMTDLAVKAPSDGKGNVPTTRAEESRRTIKQSITPSAS